MPLHPLQYLLLFLLSFCAVSIRSEDGDNVIGVEATSSENPPSLAKVPSSLANRLGTTAHNRFRFENNNGERLRRMISEARSRSTAAAAFERRKAILAGRRGVSGVERGPAQRRSRWGISRLLNIEKKTDARGSQGRRPARSKPRLTPSNLQEFPIFQPHLGKFVSPRKVKVRQRPQRKAESRVSKVMLFDRRRPSEPRSEYDSAELAFELAFGSDSGDNERLSKNSQDFDDYEDDYDYEYYEDYDDDDDVSEDEDASTRPRDLKEFRSRFRFMESSLGTSEEEDSGESDTFKFRLVKDDSPKRRHKSYDPVPLAVFGPQDAYIAHTTPYRAPIHHTSPREAIQST